MRALNHILSVILLLLLEIHIFFCSLLMFGWSRVILENVARWEFIIIMLHALIGIILTFRTHPLRSEKKYLKENCIYWLRRVTGIGIFVFSIPHISMFVHWENNSIAHLKKIVAFQMTEHVLFLLFISAHLAMNIKPMLIGMGIQEYKKAEAVLQIVTGTLAVCALVASFVYYLG